MNVNSTLQANEGINVTAGVGTFAGNVSIADKIIHTGDTNTAIRFPAGDEIQFETGGSTRLHIGSGNITQTIDTDGEGLIITTGSADMKPMVTGNSNRGAENNTIFGISGKWNNTEVGRIAFEAGADTTNKDDGKVKVYTRVSGGSLTSRLLIDSVGQIQLNTDGSQTASNISVGAGADLKLYHDGSDSYIRNISNTDLRIQNIGNAGIDIYNQNSYPITFTTNGSERARIDSSGNLKIGATANRDLGGLSAQRLHIEGTDGGGSGVGIVNNQNSTGFPSLRFAKSRGTSVGSNTVVQNNDPLGGIIFCGADGSDMVSVAAEIKCEVGGTPGSNDMPGELIFRTTADGASTSSDRMKIYANGAISIGADDNGRSFTLFNPVSSDTILRIQNDVNNEDTGLEIVNVGASGTRTFRMGGYIQANNTDTQFAASEAFRFYVDTPSGTNEALRLQTNKRVVTPQVYSTAGSSMRDVQIESDGTLAALSSITAAKINIADVTDISWLYNLKPKTFNFRKKTTDAKTGVNTYLDEAETEKAYGLLAEDVETVNKDFCFYDKDSEDNDVLAGVYYKTMVVPLIKAVQELKEENTALTARVAALEG